MAGFISPRRWSLQRLPCLPTYLPVGRDLGDAERLDRIGREPSREMKKQTKRQTDEQTDRQADRQRREAYAALRQRDIYS